MSSLASPRAEARGDIDAVSVEALAKTTTAAAVATGVATAAAILGLGFLGSLVGSALYVGMCRTASATSVTVNGEQVRAQGVGRGGRGFLGAHVVAVTDS